MVHVRRTILTCPALLVHVIALRRPAPAVDSSPPAMIAITVVMSAAKITVTSAAMTVPTTAVMIVVTIAAMTAETTWMYPASSSN